MKKYIRTIFIKLYNFIPIKRTKRYIRKKVIFSNKLSKIFLDEEKNFIGYKISDTNERTNNIHHIDKKILIDLFINTDNYSHENLYNLLNDIKLEFNLNINSKHQVNTKEMKKILHINKLSFNHQYDLNEYAFYVRLDASSIKHYNKYIINNSIQFLNSHGFSKVLLNKEKSICQLKDNEKKYLSKINISFKNTLLYNNKIENYNSNNYIINLQKVDLKYVNMLYSNQISNLFFHKVTDNVYENTHFFNNNEFKKLGNCEFSYPNKKRFKEIIKNYDIISFDIFDTLITRKIYNPDDIFYILEQKTGIKDYQKYRKKAEINAIQKLHRDVNIYEIYDEFQRILNISDNKKKACCRYEIDLELELCTPRQEMLTTIKKIKKSIVLTSDMYLTKDIIEKMLEKCGYKGLYKKIYLSNELNARKDSGKIFNILKNENFNKNIIHIGDNKISDGNEPINNGIDSLIISKPQNFVNLKVNNYGDSIIYGQIINCNKYNSPFITTKNEIEYESLYDFGFNVFGPIFLKFITWLYNEDKKEQYLLVSREGYYLKKLLDCFSEITGVKKLDTSYFYTSRRATTVAMLNNKIAAFKVLDVNYEGTIKDLLYYRFGISYAGKNYSIKLPQDKEKVQAEIDKRIKDILNNAEEERKNYETYINNNYKRIDNLCIVDLGYSGTAQFYLSKMIKQKISGKYFMLSADVKPLKIGCKVDSCFKIPNYQNFMYQNALILESFLTAPHGQVRCFDENGSPKFNDFSFDEKHFEYLNEIYRGIKDFINYIYKFLGKDITKYNYSMHNPIECYKMFFEAEKISSVIFKAFVIENYYCKNGIEKVIE